MMNSNSNPKSKHLTLRTVNTIKVTPMFDAMTLHNSILNGFLKGREYTFLRVEDSKIYYTYDDQLRLRQEHEDTLLQGLKSSLLWTKKLHWNFAGRWSLKSATLEKRAFMTPDLSKRLEKLYLSMYYSAQDPLYALSEPA